MQPAQFLSPLQVQECERDGSADGRGTWQLLGRLVYRSRIAGRTFTVPVGFVTDFASVPRVPLAFLLAGGRAHAPAVVHDWLYTVHAGLTRAQADAVFREACAARGEPGWRAWAMWAGVRVGGAGPWVAPGQVQPLGVAAAMGAIDPP